MKERKGLRLLVAVVLCIAGFVAARVSSYRETSIMLEAGGCRMVTDVIDLGKDESSGSVILLHGLAANKKIMAYMAHAFANQNLRVFVPDLPGHGRTPGPFSFSKAETCAASFAHQLTARRLIDPARTIVAGHSMGGAIAVRIAPRMRAAGVIAISPAPMSTKHGIARYLLPFENAPQASTRTLVISGGWEPQSVRETARELVDSAAADSGKYVVIPRATHVSLLFDPRVSHASQDWAARTLALSSATRAPTLLPIAGSIVGFLGVLLLAGPFLRETLGVRGPSKAAQARPEPAPADTEMVSVKLAPFLYMTLISFGAVAALKFWEPLAFVRLFDGGYFASFVLLVGLLLLIVQYKDVRALRDSKATTLALAGLAGLLIFLLVSAWFDATLMEAWLTWSRWARFAVVAIAVLPYVLAEEMLLTAPSNRNTWTRLVLALALRAIGWLALLFAIFVLHRGPILVFLLTPYFAVLSILQRAGMDVVRTQTRCVAAAAFFGAILLAGFCLVIFPVT